MADSGRNVLITGASSGIGAACALLLAREGYSVWGTTRSLDKVATLPEELRRLVRFVEMDVTDDASVKRGVDEVIRQAGQIDILINNAGFAIYGPVEEVPIELAKAQFETNVFGALRLIQAVVPAMRERGSGLVINMSSLAGKLVIPFQAHYSASKHAIEALTEGLKQELRPFGVKVVAIEPGDINTNFNNATLFGQRNDSPYQRWMDASWHAIDVNLKRAPGPEVVARKVLAVVRKANPATRYPAGDFMSTKFPFLVRFLPDSVREFAIRVFYGINFR
ncbi:MAG TPA: SDR family NAD(P)-dependent oxidoreductase [Firmicutes bacterium]|nr:SDR family NAD(P)-dependent oxidoreductase [Bacillota bacterium]